MLRKKCNRFVLLLIAELLLILLLIPGCFRKEEVVFSVVGEDIGQSVVSMDTYKIFSSEMFSLEPAVYQVRVQTRLSEGKSLYTELKYDNANFNAVKTNGVTIFSGCEYTDFEVYVSDTVSNAYMQCYFYGSDTNDLLQLDIYKTAIGNRLLVFMVIIGMAILDGMLLLRKGILEQRVTKKQQIVLWTLTAGVLLAYFPYLTDYFSLGADSLFHLERVANLKETLMNGTSLPVRIQDRWLYEHGYAVSFFYGDLCLFVPALLMLIGFPLMTAYKMFVFVVMAATAAVAYHCFKKCVKNEYAALFGSMIYLLAPYRIFNVYSRWAVGEYTAMIFLPMVCCGLYLLYTENVESQDYKKHKWYVIWGLAAILQCHIITTELVGISILLVCLLFWKKTFRKQTFLQLTLAAGLTLLVTAWYWLPMVYMLGSDAYIFQALPQTKMQSRGLWFASIFQLLPNKGSAQNGMVQCEPVHIGVGAFMLLVVYPVWKFLAKKKDGICTFLAAGSAVTIIISTRYFPWDGIMEIPVIGYVISAMQFPSRWMIVATVLAAMFAAFFFEKVIMESGTLGKAFLACVAAITVVCAVYHVNDVAFESGAVYLYEEENMGTISVGNGEYMLQEVALSELRYHEPVAEEGLEWSGYKKKGTHITISLANTSGKVRYLEVPLMGYKGYGIKTEKTGADIPVIAAERGSHGDLRIEVPAGYEGTIQIAYEGLALFKAAEVVSLVTLLAMAGWYIYMERRKVQEGKKNG
ncbi:MAG: hypothetical protein IJ282_02290 [Lachnospiraceae bacterium]|nr:hypothetical protein [Lachnospiraceae bacterium]